MGYRPKETVENLTFGTALHGGVEEFDRQVFSGVKREDALIAALKVALQLGAPLHHSKDTSRTIETLTRAIVWYTEQFKNDQAVTALLPNGHPALEVRYEVPWPGTRYRFSGRIDKLASINDELYVVERKTTDAMLSDYYFNRYSPNTQVSAYIWALSEFLGVRVSGVMIEAFQTAVSFTRIERAIVRRSLDQVLEFVDNTAMYLNHADEYHDKGVWPMNESACMLYGGCKFRGVCERPAERRKSWLDSDFDLKPYKR